MCDLIKVTSFSTTPGQSQHDPPVSLTEAETTAEVVPDLTSSHFSHGVCEHTREVTVNISSLNQRKP